MKAVLSAAAVLIVLSIPAFAQMGGASQASGQAAIQGTNAITDGAKQQAPAPVPPSSTPAPVPAPTPAAPK